MESCPSDHRATADLRRAALVAAGSLLLMAVLAGVGNLAVIEPALVLDDEVATASNIADSLSAFRLATAALLMVVGLDLVVAWALRNFFAPVDRGLASLAAWFRLSYAVVFAVAISGLVRSANLIETGAAPGRVLDATQFFATTWELGLALFGVHLLLVGWLCLRADRAPLRVPNVVGWLVIVAGSGYLIDSFTVVATGEDPQLGAVAFVGEVVLLGWLLARGGREATPRHHVMGIDGSDEQVG